MPVNSDGQDLRPPKRKFLRLSVNLRQALQTPGNTLSAP